MVQQEKEVNNSRRTTLCTNFYVQSIGDLASVSECSLIEFLSIILQTYCGKKLLSLYIPIIYFLLITQISPYPNTNETDSSYALNQPSRGCPKGVTSLKLIRLNQDSNLSPQHTKLIAYQCTISLPIINRTVLFPENGKVLVVVYSPRILNTSAFIMIIGSM